MKIRNKLKFLLMTTLGCALLFSNGVKAAPKDNAIDITKGEERVFVPYIDSNTQLETNLHKHITDSPQIKNYTFYMLADKDFRPENKGKWYLRYKNVGNVAGENVDLVVKLKDWSALDINEAWWRENHIANNNSLGDLKTKSDSEIKAHYNKDYDYGANEAKDFDDWVHYDSQYVDSTMSMFIRKAYNKPLRTLNVMDPKHLITPISSVNMSVSLSLPYVEIEQYLVKSTDKDINKSTVDLSNYKLKLTMNINDVDWGQSIHFNKKDITVDTAEYKKNGILSKKEESNYFTIQSKPTGDNNTDKSAVVMTFSPKKDNKNLKLNYIYTNLNPNHFSLSQVLSAMEKNRNLNQDLKDSTANPLGTEMMKYAYKNDGTNWTRKGETYPIDKPQSIFSESSNNTVGANNIYFFGSAITSELSNLYASKMEKNVTDADERSVLSNILRNLDETYTYNIKGYVPSLVGSTTYLKNHTFTDKLDNRLEYVKDSLKVVVAGKDYTKNGSISWKDNQLTWTANKEFLNKKEIQGAEIFYTFNVKIKDSMKKGFDFNKDIINIANQTSHDYKSESNKTITKIKQIKILKVNDKGGKLKGVEFSLYDKSKKFIKKAMTNENGELFFDDLKDNVYYVRETKSIKGYRLNEQWYQANFEKNNSNIIELKITNTPTKPHSPNGEPTSTGTLGVTLSLVAVFAFVGLAIYHNSRIDKKNKKDK